MTGTIKIINYCAKCAKDCEGGVRKMVESGGVKCHVCGNEATSGYHCECGAPLYWMPGGDWYVDAEPPTGEVFCEACGYKGFRYRPGGYR